jgi:CRISPR/Cas system Type II protein with McrA/HNH and RuvC-like nuclease domain
MQFELRTKSELVSKEDIIKDLRGVAQKLNKNSISEMEYNKNGRYTHKIMVKIFGSWNNAIKKAGLNIVVNKTISDEELFKNLEKIWVTLGRQPFYSEIRKPISKFAVDTYCRRFGGWSKTCALFIKHKNKNSQILFKSTKSRRKTLSRAITERLRLKVFKRDNYKCVICGKSPATHLGTILHIDHIKPFSDGGDSSIENLRTLCQKCNLGKGNQNY